MVEQETDNIYELIAILCTTPLFLLIIAWLVPFKYIKIFFNLSVLKIKKQIPTTLQNNSYYSKLEDKEKQKFRERVFEFILFKKFQTYGNINITNPMKIQVAATAVQITFGYTQKFEYLTFKRIIISPKDYRSRITHKMHKGETNPNAGYIALSWESFIEGNKFQHDCVNVGLHEFAHAQFSDELAGYDNKEFFKSIDKWKNKVAELCKKEKTHQFFRKYAFVNLMEFFAVSMEYFFEDPKAFNQQFPELYKIMCNMLNQNPLLENNGIKRESLWL